MRKTILGIAVVICLDLAFIFVVMQDVNQFELAKAIDSPIVNPVSITQRLETAQIIEEPELAVAPPEVVPVDLDREPSASRTYRRLDNARKVRKPQERLVAGNNPPVKFEDTIIWIPRANYAPAGEKAAAPDASIQSKPVEPVSAPPTAKPVMKEKKRNFFQRAYPVVKKPYDWLRMIAEKLS